MRKGENLFTALEALRGIAAIMVVFRHTEGAIGPGQVMSSYLSVDLFFLLSGFVLANSYEWRLKTAIVSPAGFFLLRVIRLYPLYLLSLPFGIASYAIAHGDNPLRLLEIGLKAALFIPNLDTDNVFPINNPSWSLFFELWVGLFFAVILVRLSQRSLLLVAAASAGMTIVGTLGTGSFDLGYEPGNLIFGFSRVLLSFCLGVALQRWHVPEKSLGKGNTSGLVLCLCLFILLEMPPGMRLADPRLFDLFCCLIAFPALIWFAVHIRPTGMVDIAFRWLGKLSYPIYVLHSPIFSLLHSLKQRSFVPAHSIALGYAVLFAVFAVSAIAAICFDEPIRRKLLKVLRPTYPPRLSMADNVRIE